MSAAKQDIPSVLCHQSNEGLCLEKWMAELTYELNTRCPTVAKILPTLLACDLTHPGKKQPPICLSAVFMWHACLSQIYKYIGQACWLLVLYLFDRQDKNVILIM